MEDLPRPRTGPAVVPAPPCPHRPPCPGCPRYGEPGIDAAAAGRLRAIAEHAGAVLERPVCGAAIGYRCRSRLMVRGRTAAPRIGLFEAGSHRIVHVPGCPVHHPAINRVADALGRAMRATGAAPYADRPHRGLVRALQAVVERASQRVQAVVVCNETDPGARTQALLEAFARECGAALHSLWWNGNPQRTNVILGDRWERHGGAETVCERIGGAQVFFPPGAFGQANLALAERLVERIHRIVLDGAERPLRVVELHAGCGTIGLGLLARGHEVAFNERSAHALRGLERGLRARPPQQRARARRLPGSAASAEVLAALGAADVAIVDPPRKGLEPALCAALAAAPPPRLVYTSCGLESFERDARRLLAGGALRLVRLVPFALFPWTAHVETLALFEARGTRPRADIA